jgi:phage-related protein
MRWTIEHYSPAVEEAILSLPPGLLARYLRLGDMLCEFGPHLGMPHTRALGDGLIELRIKGAEGIARTLFCCVAQRRIVMLHVIIKKARRIPLHELRAARRRMEDVKTREPR